MVKRLNAGGKSPTDYVALQGTDSAARGQQFTYISRAEHSLGDICVVMDEEVMSKGRNLKAKKAPEAGKGDEAGTSAAADGNCRALQQVPAGRYISREVDESTARFAGQAGQAIRRRIFLAANLPTKDYWEGVCACDRNEDECVY